MKKYLQLYWAFFRASMTADLEFRANFATKIVTDIFWYGAQIISFEVLFNFTDDIGEWNRAQMRIFLGILFVVDAIYMVMFSTNLDTFSDGVRKGSLDLMLTKPANSQFVMSCQRASTAHLGNLAMGVAWLAWALSNQNEYVGWRLLWLIPLIPAGVLIFYSIRFLFSAVALIFTRAENIQYMFYSLYKLSMRPDTIYPPWLKYTVLTIAPFGLIGSVPARVALGMASSYMALWVVAVALLCLFVTTRFWKYALSQYTSASS
jgi:ABC-2 type transport system permease protein